MTAETPSTVLVYVTASSSTEALEIADDVIGARLAACANVIPGMTSVYRWQGEVRQEQEVVLLFKTRSELVAALTERVTARHSYDCPCVVAVPIVDGKPEFLSWIVAETTA
jgi:periplasmic divalent cation tolerance protein